MDDHMNQTQNEQMNNENHNDGQEPSEGVYNETMSVMAEPKQKRSKRPVIIALCSLLIIVAAGIAGFFLSGDMRAYSAANRLKKQGEFSSAAEAFTELGDYKDAENLYKECIYNLSIEKFGVDDYEGALNYLKMIPDYDDEKHIFEKSNCQMARQHLNAGNPSKAITILEKIPDYTETGALLDQSKYEYGKQLVKGRDYEKAARYLGGLDYADSKALYEKALALTESIGYEGKIYITPQEFIDKINEMFGRLDMSCVFPDVAEGLDTIDYYTILKDHKGRGTSISLVFVDVDEEEGTITDIMYRFDFEDVEAGGVMAVVFSVLDSSYNKGTSDNILQELLYDALDHKDRIGFSRTEKFMYSSKISDDSMSIILSAR